MLRAVAGVELADWRHPLSKLEISRLLYAFVEERSALLAMGSHQARELLIPLGAGLTWSSFGPVASDPNGCTVISFAIADPKIGSFKSITGEQAPCGGSSTVNER